MSQLVRRRLDALRTQLGGPEAERWTVHICDEEGREIITEPDGTKRMETDDERDAREARWREEGTHVIRIGGRERENLADVSAATWHRQ